jgi:NADH dehydrogenase [ubiquinone] 1 alpha subcomplex assembly factor 3
MVYMIEILLLGTGLKVVMPPPSLKQHLSELGIQLDIMDTVSPSLITNLH